MTIARRRRYSRRAGVAMLTVAVAFFVAGRTERSRAATVASPLGSYSLSATAPGAEITEDRPDASTHPEGEGSVPHTSTALITGGVGYGLSTIFWPGPLAGNAGSLLQLLAPTSVNGVPIPDAIQQLVYPNLTAANDPVRAEARTGQPDGHFDNPASTLTAHADANKVNAVATVNGAQVPGFMTYGSSNSQSTSTLSGDGAVGQATATSAVSNVDIGGVIKIGSVTSDATASTNGTTATASGHTVVHDMTIAGQPASIDDSGLHIGGSSQPLNATANEIATQALSQSGMQLFVSAPRLEKSGASANFTAGSLLIMGTPQGSKSTFTMTLGGARVSVTSSPGFDVASLDTGVTTPAPVAPVPSTTAPRPSSSSGSSPASSSAAPTVTEPSAPGEITAGAAPTPSAAAAPLNATPAANTSSPFGGISIGVFLLGLAGAGLLGAGFRRATDDILEKAATACPLER